MEDKERLPWCLSTEVPPNLKRIIIMNINDNIHTCLCNMSSFPSVVLEKKIYRKHSVAMLSFSWHIRHEMFCMT